MLVSKVQGLKGMKVRRSLNCRVGKVPFGLVSRTVVLIEGIIVGGNPNIGLVTEAEANCCRAGFWGVRRRGSQRCHDIGQDMGKAEVEAWPQMLRGLVIDPMEEVTIDRMSVKFRVTRHLPLAIIRVRCVQSRSWGKRPARAVGGFRRKNNSATIKADERN